MRRFIIFGLLLLLCTVPYVRADTEVLKFTFPVQVDLESLSTTGLIPPSPDVLISSWKESVRFQPTKFDPSKQTILSRDGKQKQQQQQTRDVWLELDSDRLLVGRMGKVNGLLKVSWLARPSTALSIAGPIPNQSDHSKTYLKISTTYLTTQQTPELIIVLEPLYLGILPRSSLPLIGMLLMILFGLRRIGAYSWLIRRVGSIVKDGNDKSR